MKEKKPLRGGAGSNIGSVILLAIFIIYGIIPFATFKDLYYRYFSFYSLVLIIYYLISFPISKYFKDKLIGYIFSLIPINMATTVIISELLVLDYITKEEASINLKLFYLFQIIIIIIIRIVKGKGFTIRHF